MTVCHKISSALRWAAIGALLSGSVLLHGSALAQEKISGSDRPNILVIMGDDVGYWNLSYNNQGMMGY